MPPGMVQSTIGLEGHWLLKDYAIAGTNKSFLVPVFEVIRLKKCKILPAISSEFHSFPYSLDSSLLKDIDTLALCRCIVEENMAWSKS